MDTSMMSMGTATSAGGAGAATTSEDSINTTTGNLLDQSLMSQQNT
jgi:hypothetical protein